MMREEVRARAGGVREDVPCAAVETTGLAVGYDEAVLVSGLDLCVMPGQVVTLIGPNGAGKSTILKALAGQLDPMAGSVLLLGEDLRGLSPSEQARMRAVLLTERLSTSLLTCRDVVAMGRYPFTGSLGLTRDEDRSVVQASMELLEVLDLAEKDFMQLSDGQRQRVLLARALCQEPRVLLLDEPTSYLDIRYQIELLGLLRRLAHAQDLAIVMTLHDLSLARQVSDWLVCVREGHVLAQGTPGQIFAGGVLHELFDLGPGMLDVASGMVLLPPQEAADEDEHEGRRA